MIIYYAGVGGNVTDFYTAIRAGGCRHVMLSYYYKDSPRQIERFRHLGLHLFLDSGAYTAWTKNVEVDIDEYVEYIKMNHIGKYIVLDAILEDRNEGAEKTYQNLKYMESKGLLPVPVFHAGSDMKYLQRLVDDGYEYVCLGGTVGLKRPDRRKFFDRVFEQFPDVFFHGLGMTDAELIKEYPWFSVDSTTWLIGRKYNKLQTDHGRIVFPEGTPLKERLASNVEFFVNLEDEVKSG